MAAGGGHIFLDYATHQIYYHTVAAYAAPSFDRSDLIPPVTPVA